jgi:glycerol-3-phosphate acyltransferase PlsX
MTASPTIALDAMGGDHGPDVIVPAAELALIRHPDAEFIIVGDAARITPLLMSRERLRERARVVHTDTFIPMDAKPSQALRMGRRTSSMWLALRAVRDGEAHATVSAGNTGALMAMAKHCFKTIGDVERPALAALWPTIRSYSIVLDLGANVGADAQELTRFALMGAAMARALFHIERPSVGLLNTGEEHVSGLDEIRRAHNVLCERNDLGIDYRGFVHGDGISQGLADVIVTNGVTGNIVLKIAEGTAKQVVAFMRDSFTSSFSAKLGAGLARSGLDALRKRMDPRRHNGAVFLGLQGTVIKSHGGGDDVGFANAIAIAHGAATADLARRISSDLSRLRLN